MAQEYRYVSLKHLPPHSSCSVPSCVCGLLAQPKVRSFYQVSHFLFLAGSLSLHRATEPESIQECVKNGTDPHAHQPQERWVYNGHLTNTLAEDRAVQWRLVALMDGEWMWQILNEEDLDLLPFWICLHRASIPLTNYTDVKWSQCFSLEKGQSGHSIGNMLFGCLFHKGKGKANRMWQE